MVSVTDCSFLVTPLGHEWGQERHDMAGRELLRILPTIKAYPIL